jgi:hypothetical protein
LCEDVRALLDELAADCGFAIDEINIESAADLFARYRYAVPVVLIDGREVARGRIDERALTAALVRASQR